MARLVQISSLAPMAIKVSKAPMARLVPILSTAQALPKALKVTVVPMVQPFGVIRVLLVRWRMYGHYPYRHPPRYYTAHSTN
jgi:hypothetical protein